MFFNLQQMILKGGAKDIKLFPGQLGLEKKWKNWKIKLFRVKILWRRQFSALFLAHCFLYIQMGFKPIECSCL